MYSTQMHTVIKNPKIYLNLTILTMVNILYGKYLRALHMVLLLCQVRYKVGTRLHMVVYQHCNLAFY